MTYADLFGLSLSALWKQKLRTALTLLGVVIGTTTLGVSLSVGIGIRQVIEDQFHKEERLRQIDVFPNYNIADNSSSDIPHEITEVPGTMSEARRERIKERRIQEWRQFNFQRVPKPITDDLLEQIQSLPQVESVIPDVDGGVRLLFENQLRASMFFGIVHDNKRLKSLLEAGEAFDSSAADQIILNEYLLYQLGIKDEAEIPNLFGKKVTLEISTDRRSPVGLLSLFGSDASQISVDELQTLEKTFRQLPQALEKLDLSPAERQTLQKALARKRPQKEEKTTRVRKEFTLIGVVRSPQKKKQEDTFFDSPFLDRDVFLPLETAKTFIHQLPFVRDEGYRHVTVIVKKEEQLQTVVDHIRSLGLREFSLGLFIEQVRTNVLLIGFGMNFIALIALCVAALGITNTLFTSVLERTREIGIMKAVGAQDRHILGIFLIEGSLLGILGGSIGLLLAWLISFPADQVALSLIANQPHPTDDVKIPETVFRYPIWMLVAIPMFATLITTLAALLPARQAAKVHPVVALRHE